MADEPTSDTRERLVAAASDLFSAQGYDGTSVEAIVRAAGLTKGSFYHHFDSKADCLRSLHEAFIDGELHRLEQAVSASVDPADAVFRITRCFLLGVEQYHALFRIFDQEWRALESDDSSTIRVQRDRIAEIVVAQIEAGVEGGYFSADCDPAVVGLGLIGMCGWAHRWLDPRGSLTAGDIADAWSHNLLSGIRRTG